MIEFKTEVEMREEDLRHARKDLDRATVRYDDLHLAYVRAAAALFQAEVFKLECEKSEKEYIKLLEEAIDKEHINKGKV